MRCFAGMLLLFGVACGGGLSRTEANGDETLLAEPGTLVEITGRLEGYTRATASEPGKLTIEGRRYGIAPNAGVKNESDVVLGALVRAHGQVAEGGLLSHVFVQRAFGPVGGGDSAPSISVLGSGNGSN